MLFETDPFPDNLCHRGVIITYSAGPFVIFLSGVTVSGVTRNVLVTTLTFSWNICLCVSLFTLNEREKNIVSVIFSICSHHKMFLNTSYHTKHRTSLLILESNTSLHQSINLVSVVTPWTIVVTQWTFSGLRRSKSYVHLDWEKMWCERMVGSKAKANWRGPQAKTNIGPKTKNVQIIPSAGFVCLFLSTEILLCAIRARLGAAVSVHSLPMKSKKRLAHDTTHIFIPTKTKKKMACNIIDICVIYVEHFMTRQKQTVRTARHTMASFTFVFPAISHVERRQQH